MESATHSIPFSYRHKIKFEDNPTYWDHHRGGWTYAFNTLRRLEAPDGILCISAVEEWILDDKPIKEPWVGFVHQVPRNNYRWYPDLERLVTNEHFLESLSSCHGLFVLSRTVKQYLQTHLDIPNLVVCVLYPITPFGNKVFNWDMFNSLSPKRVLFIGEFLRNYQAFYDLKVPEGFQKLLLKPSDVNFDKLLDCNKQKITLNKNNSVALYTDRISDDQYDNLLSSSIVFLNFFDAAANTTVNECIGRNTPLIVNRLPALEEYLGKEYPLFYETLEDAAAFLLDTEKLVKASQYMNSLSIKNRLTQENFLQSFASSSIYRSLPLPQSQTSDGTQTKFPKFDVTIAICSYKRVYNLRNLLECFEKQDYAGRFEIILWNNNDETQEEVAKISAPYKKNLNIRLIQSSQNYYCIVRVAIAKLMQSDVLLICDDDVVPKPNYLSTFMKKYQEYAAKYDSRVALCCRGHVFAQHSLNAEEPHKFWEEYKHMKFYNEEQQDREVCFQIFTSLLLLHSIS